MPAWSSASNPQLAASLGVVACASLVLGAKFWLVAVNGSITPFWDQWDGEAAALYQPYLSGEFSWLDLFSAHNEHRIFFSRALALSLLEFSGQWDTSLQMLVNAIVHVSSIVLLLIALGRAVTASGHFGLCLFTGVVFALPFGWENTLGGFQSPFYFLLLCSIAAIILLMPAPALGVRWWVGTGLALASALCLASGALTLVPIVGLRALQLLLLMRSGRREWAGLGVHVVATVAAMLTLPPSNLLGPLTLSAVELYLSALWTLIAWPRPSTWWAPILIYFPLLILFIVTCLRRPPASDPTWVCLAVGSWVLVQLACFVYGRTFAPLASRYLDVHLAGTVASFAAVFVLISHRSGNMTADFARTVAGVAWTAVISYYLVNTAILELPSAIAGKRETSQMQTENVRAFLQSGDASVFTDQPWFQVPYPVPDRLVSLLRDHTIRSLLPKELGGRGGAPPDVRAKLGLHGAFASQTASFKATLLQSPALLLSGSFTLFIFAAFAAARRAYWQLRGGKDGAITAPATSVRLERTEPRRLDQELGCH